MKISSPAFAENAKIPKIYSKLGGNQRPPLEISDVPAEAKSLVIICHDPDAPGRDGFYHWTVWNLSPETTEIAADTLPNGAVEGITSWGRSGYGGPQPPFGTHRYQFFVYALNTMLDIPAATKPQALSATMQLHIVDQAVLTGMFSALDTFRK
ncbi:YbhB/YbcL family Raf kinase inhibitor-like protein [TM7 phylum sp. oral taxon 346]|jgi:Raf-like protein|nr:YbhB/YbcL family Raf kinase inhibitor-like protein [TM7 phylum sp. oral taxon 346]